jgi:Ulp1 protease family, C-terminal catalytic domain
MVKIHPISYCVFANDENMTVETKNFLAEHWGSEPSYGDPKPLFGWSCSTANEGEHNGMTFDTSRKCGPLTILEKWGERANDRVVHLRKCTKQVKAMKSGLFEWPSTHLHRQANQCILYKVKETPNENVFHVQKRKDTIKGKEHDVHFVDVFNVACSGCSHFSQLRCACRHLLAVIHYLKTKKKKHCILSNPEYCIENFYHKGYLVKEVSKAYHWENTLYIPTRSTLSEDDVILPSPNYRNLTSKKKKDRPKFKDRLFPNDRIRSNGEQRRTSSSRIHAGHNEWTVDFTEQLTINHHFKEQQAIAEVKAMFNPCPEGMRKLYHCSICKDTSHNCQTCPVQKQKEVRTHPNTLKPGIYMLGECPFTTSRKMHSVNEMLAVDYQYYSSDEEDYSNLRIRKWDKKEEKKLNKKQQRKSQTHNLEIVEDNKVDDEIVAENFVLWKKPPSPETDMSEENIHSPPEYDVAPTNLSELVGDVKPNIVDTKPIDNIDPNHDPGNIELSDDFAFITHVTTPPLTISEQILQNAIVQQQLGFYGNYPRVTIESKCLLPKRFEPLIGMISKNAEFMESELKEAFLPLEGMKSVNDDTCLYSLVPPQFDAMGLHVSLRKMRLQLFDSAWLHCDLVKCWTTLLHHSYLNPKLNETTFVACTYFYNKLFQSNVYCFQKVRKWVKKWSLEDKKLHQFVIPIHINDAHWFLMVVKKEMRQIWLIDSLDNANPDLYFNNVMHFWSDYMRDRGEVDIDCSQWQFIVKSCTLQDDSVSCGIFMCANMLMLCNGYKSFNYPKGWPIIFRRYMVYCLHLPYLFLMQDICPHCGRWFIASCSVCNDPDQETPTQLLS